MNWKKKIRLFNKIGFVLIALTPIPTLYWAVTSVIHGEYGISIDNFKGQSINPVVVLIVFGTLVIALPMIYFKNKE